MKPDSWIGIGAGWTGVAVAMGAFGAHALNARLVDSGHLDDWETAVRYQAWHGLALVLFGLWRRARPGGGAIGWCLLVGSVLFSGSIYGLSLDGPGGVLGPVTPLGGALLLVGWGIFAGSALLGGGSRPMDGSGN